VAETAGVIVGPSGGRRNEGLPKPPGKRDDGNVKRGEENEAEFYRAIVRRAKTVRERAAESLRLSRLLRKRQGNVGNESEARPKSRWKN
jgi:hypothetical protein